MNKILFFQMQNIFLKSLKRYSSIEYINQTSCVIELFPRQYFTSKIAKEISLSVNFFMSDKLFSPK